MSESNSDPRLSEIRDRIVASVQARLGDAWSDYLTDDERTLVIACCNDAAVVQIDALAGRTNVDADLKQIAAQMANIQSIGKTRVASVVLVAAKDVVLGLLEKLANAAVVAAL